MKNMKKPIAFTVAAALSAMQMVVCYAPIEVCAAGTGTLTATADKETVSGSDTFTVSVALADNPGFRGLQFSVGYDENTFVVDGDPNATNAIGTEINVAKDQSKNSTPVYAVMTSYAKLSGETTSNGTILTVNFKLKDGAVNGDYEFPITNIKADKADYTPATVVSGTTLKVKVTGNKANYTGTTPGAPTVNNIKATAFDVSVPAANEYTYSTAAISDFSTAVWHKSTETTVTGLSPNTKYYVYQRVAETETVKASPASVAAEATTAKLAAGDVIQSVSIGDEATASKVLTPSISYKPGYSETDLGTVSYKWQNDTTANTYTVSTADVSAKTKIKVTVSGSNVEGSVISNELTAGLAKNTTVPTAPEVIPTADGGTITAVTGQEYYVSDTNVLPADAVWTTAPAAVTGKAPNSKFYVWTRIKATETVDASVPSEVREVRVPNDDAALASLTVSGGNLSPAFASDVFDYTVSLPVDVAVPPAVTYTAKDPKASAILTKTASDLGTNNVTEITVTAENNTKVQKYTVTYQHVTAILTDLNIDGASVSGFDPMTLSYVKKISYADWSANKSKVYTVGAAAAATATVSISEPSVTLTSPNPDTATNHPVKITVTDATGTTVYTLNFVVEACAHAWDAGVETTPATSIANGVKTYTCSVCGKTRTETIPMIGRAWDDGVITTPPTCTALGEITYTDKNSGETFKRAIPATGHSWDDGVITTPATGTTNGVKTYTCKNCGEKKTEVIPATGETSTPATSTQNKPVSTDIQIGGSSGSGANSIPAYGPPTASPTPAPVSPVITSSPSVNVNPVKPVAKADTEPGDGAAVIDEDIVIKADLNDIDASVDRNGNATVTWGAVDGASSYTVYVYKNGSYKKYKTTKDTSAVLKGLKNNKTYKVLVKYKANGKLSAEKDSYKIEFKVYNRPAVKATAKKNSVVLKWDAVPGASEYAVYKVEKGKFVKLGETDKTSYKVTNLKAGTTYKFIVRANVDGEWSKASKSDIIAVKTEK